MTSRKIEENIEKGNTIKQKISTKISSSPNMGGGYSTGVGALIAILVKNLSNRVVSLSLGFASGIMIGISALSWPDAGNSYGFTHSLRYYFL